MWIERDLSLNDRGRVRNGYSFADSIGRKMASRDLEPNILKIIIEEQY